MGASGPREIKCAECGDWKEKLSKSLCNACHEKADEKKREQDSLIKEMVDRLNAAGAGGSLAPWFAKWNDRAIKYLADREKK